MIVTRTVTIDGSKQTEPIHTETIRHTTMPTEIITKTITIEGDGAPLTAQELKEIMAQQGGNIDSEIITTVSNHCLGLVVQSLISANLG